MSNRQCFLIMLTRSSMFLLIYKLERDVLKSYFMMMALSICLCSSDHYCFMCFEVMLLNRQISNLSIILVISKLLSTCIGSLSTNSAVRINSPLYWCSPGNVSNKWQRTERQFLIWSIISVCEPVSSVFSVYCDYTYICIYFQNFMISSFLTFVFTYYFFAFPAFFEKMLSVFSILYTPLLQNLNTIFLGHIEI